MVSDMLGGNKRWILFGLLSFLLNCVLVSCSVEDIEKAANDSFLWGPYRPNLYVGIRPKIPDSLMTGLMWSNVDDYARFSSMSRLQLDIHIGINII